MIAPDFVEALERIKPAIKSFIEMILRVKNREVAFEVRKFSFVENQMVDFFNALPESFQQFRDKVAVAFFDLAVVHEHRSHSFFTVLFFNLSKLKCSPDVAQMIGGSLSAAKEVVEWNANWRKNRYGYVVLTGLIVFSMYNIVNRCKEKHRPRLYSQHAKASVALKSSVEICNEP